MEERNKPKLEDLESRIKALEDEIHKFKLDYLKGRIQDREEKRFSDKKINDSIQYVYDQINSVESVVNLDNPYDKINSKDTIESVINLDNPEEYKLGEIKAVINLDNPEEYKVGEIKAILNIKEDNQNIGITYT